MKGFAKTLLILLTLAILSGLVIACGAQPTPETITKVETVVVEKEKVVTQEVEKVVTKEVEKVVTKEVEKEVVKEVRPIVYNSYNGDPEPRRVDEMLVQMFNEQHPETPVQHSIIAHEDFKQAIRAYLVADPAPDVMTWFAGNRARFFIDKGLIMDISDVWESEGWNEDYPKGFKALSTVDGKQYFLPSSWYWWAIFYRKSVFEENGITPPETWDELLATCDALNDKGIIPITIGTKFRWTAAAWFDYINMRLNGPEFHRDLMLGKERYDDPRVRAVFDKWNELFDHNCFIEDAAAYSWQDALDPFNRGEAAMYLMGQFILDSVADEVKDDVDFFRFPIIDPNVPIGEDAPTDGFFMSANARNPEGGKEFLAFMGSVEAQTIMVKELGRLPVHSKVDPSLFNPMQQKGIELIQGADLVMQFYDRDTTPEMADVGMNGFMAFWDDPTAIDDILADLEASRQEIFAGQ
ncbi:MAG: carbohydrate ABC transporter substrate-binding protein [Caldilineae bacterium]|nr:MAG: carbohydrate ABC transporter substrate-binding protein [Caldilineae bacterium]